MIITIDGPAGSGKSTAARELAKRLGIAYLDTGATYRALTLKALRGGADLRDERALARLARSADIRLTCAPGGTRVLLDGSDVSEAIRTEEVSANAHFAASAPAVREVLVELQRRLGRELGDFVAEGRDQGTVVFPDAEIKFYVTASAEARARRRCDELTARGEPAKHEDVLRAIIERDRRDETRAVAPLCKPSGAIEVDTTDRTIAQTAETLCRHVEAHR